MNRIKERLLEIISNVSGQSFRSEAGQLTDALEEKTPHFNILTPAQAERLALLSEELGEAQQAIGKILRHGYESYHPRDVLQVSNRERLEKECGDVRHAMIRLCNAGDLNKERIHEHADDKAITVQQWLHHN